MQRSWRLDTPRFNVQQMQLSKKFSDTDTGPHSYVFISTSYDYLVGQDVVVQSMFMGMYSNIDVYYRYITF